MDVTDGASASSPHIIMMDGVSTMKRRRPLQTSGELRRVVIGGYDATFTRAGPDAKHMCTVCGKVLRQPVQTKCGHRFCSSCINSIIRAGEGLCPEADCNSVLTDADLFPDAFAEREVLNLDVICSAVTDQCPWTGKLRDLEVHTDQCQYVKVVCGQNSCPDLVQRRFLNQHRQEACHYRFINCQHCHAPVVFYSMQEHQLQCQEWPMDCPQQCEVTGIPRSKVQEHLENHCQLTVAPCQFAFVGCLFKGDRGQMVDHLQRESSVHLVQLASLCNLQQRQLAERSKEVTALQTQLDDVVQHLRAPSKTLTSAASSPVKSGSGFMSSLLGRRGSPPSSASPTPQPESEALKKALDRINQLEQDLNAHNRIQSHNGVLIWRIDEFAKKRRQAMGGSIRHWTSDPFYTSPHGYKLCARVYLDGDGLGTGAFISLYIMIVRGEHDALLKWPFSARVTLTLLDQGANHHHHHEKFIPDNRHTSFGRPMGEANVASGCPRFFQLSALEHFGYVQNDSIVFRVCVDAATIQGVDSPNFA